MEISARLNRLKEDTLISSNTQVEILKKYYYLLYPSKLRDDEFIKIHLSKVDKMTGEKIEFDRWVRSFDEYLEVVKKYRNNFNMYNELATIKSNPKEERLNGKEKNLYRRQVLYIDFDKKDYPDLGDDVYKFTSMIKEKLPDVFIHAIYNSGGGFHFYFSVKQTKIKKDHRMMTDLNLEIARLVGADENACKITQIARIPTTFNMKLIYEAERGKYPMVLEIDHYQNHPDQKKNYHPLDCNNLRREVENAKKRFSAKELEEVPFKEWKYDTGEIDIKQYGCLCTEKVFREGANEGERNTWLGRIIVWLRREGYRDYKIEEKCQEWNAICRPPKSRNEISNDVKGWFEWLAEHGESKIGGCYWAMEESSRTREIVRKQCDKYFCKQALNQYDSLSISEDVGVKMNQSVLTDKKLTMKSDKRSEKYIMSGYEYLILTVLDKYMPKTGRTPFTVRDLKYRMQFKKSGKWQLCMDIETFKYALSQLEEHKCIKLSDPSASKRNKNRVTYDDKRIKLTKSLKDFESKGYIEFYYSAARAFICRQITQREYKVYLCLINNLKNGKSCTLEKLDMTLNMGKENILKSLQNLERASCLDIEHMPANEKGSKYNLYHMKDTDKWNDDTNVEAHISKKEWNLKLIA